MRKKSHWRIAEIGTTLLLGALSFQLTGCSHSSAGAAQPTPPDVEVVTVSSKGTSWSTASGSEPWDGMVNAAIRAQVTGHLLTQDCSEGSFVKKGRLLFQIDPRPLQTAADQAQGQLAQANGQLAQAHAQYQQSVAQLASAEANQSKAQFDEDPYTPLEGEVGGSPTRQRGGAIPEGNSNRVHRRFQRLDRPPTSAGIQRKTRVARGGG